MLLIVRDPFAEFTQTQAASEHTNEEIISMVAYTWTIRVGDIRVEIHFRQVPHIK